MQGRRKEKGEMVEWREGYRGREKGREEGKEKDEVERRREERRRVKERKGKTLDSEGKKGMMERVK